MLRTRTLLAFGILDVGIGELAKSEETTRAQKVAGAWRLFDGTGTA
jgi:hypothetical protein